MNCRSRISAGLSLLLLGAFSAFVIGCATSKPPAQKRTKTMRDYEREYDPIKKVPPESMKKRTETPQENIEVPPQPEIQKRRTERIEKQPGFRVQIFSSTNLDEATHRRDAMQLQVDSVKTYLVYDAPYYKVRLGDYSARDEALVLKQALNALGYKEAWIVPDQVNKLIVEE